MYVACRMWTVNHTQSFIKVPCILSDDHKTRRMGASVQFLMFYYEHGKDILAQVNTVGDEVDIGLLLHTTNMYRTLRTDILILDFDFCRISKSSKTVPKIELLITF